MKLPRDVGPIHFIGIGGIGMSGIAEVMATLNYKVQGSDISDNYNVLPCANGVVGVGFRPAASRDLARFQETTDFRESGYRCTQRYSYEHD